MKLLPILWIASHAYVAAQVPVPAPLLVEPDTGQTEIVIERFASPSMEISVSFISSPQPQPQVIADVFLDGGKLLAPLFQSLPFHPAVSSNHPYLTKGSFTIPLVAVNKPVSLRLVFRSSANPSDGARVIGKALLRITPRGTLEELLTKRVENTLQPVRLIVFGKATGLREMLSGWHILFTDAGPNPPGSAPADTLMIGETNDLSRLPVLTMRSSLFVLSADPSQDTDSVIHDSVATRSTIVRSSGDVDWGAEPRLHRMLAKHLTKP